MEDQCSPLCWPYYYYQDEGVQELKHSLLYTTLELETTIVSAQEELARKNDEISHLKSLVSKISKERDEAQEKCQTLMLENLLIAKQLQQQQQQQNQNQIDGALSSGTTSNEDEQPRRVGLINVVHSSSDCDENFIASPGTDLLVDVNEKIVVRKPLPEKGKFLQAVMEAGPLLQTLLLAGPLPQWQVPPPQLKTIDIPPVTVSSPVATTPRLLHHQDSCLSTNGYFSKKRVLEHNSTEGFDTSPNSKYQRFVDHQSLLTNI